MHDQLLSSHMLSNMARTERHDDMVQLDREQRSKTRLIIDLFEVFPAGFPQSTRASIYTILSRRVIKPSPPISRPGREYASDWAQSDRVRSRQRGCVGDLRTIVTLKHKSTQKKMSRTVTIARCSGILGSQGRYLGQPKSACRYRRDPLQESVCGIIVDAPFRTVCSVIRDCSSLQRASRTLSAGIVTRFRTDE